MSAFNTNLSVTRRKANGVKAPLLQQEWGCSKVESLQGACEDLEWHRRDVCVCVCEQCRFPFLYSLGENSFLPRQGWQPQPGAFPAPAELCSQLSSTHFLPLSLSWLFLNPHYLLLSFPGPWEQRDPLPEGRHLERVLPPVQGDAGAVCSAHPAQQPPEAAVRRRLRHRWVSTPERLSPDGSRQQDTRKRMGMTGREEGACSPSSHLLWTYLPE